LPSAAADVVAVHARRRYHIYFTAAHA
jgi:hypothetical protein